MDNTNSSPESTAAEGAEESGEQDLDQSSSVEVDLSGAEQLDPSLPEELQELDEEEEGEEESSGLVAGAFGFASLVLGFLSLGGTWLGTAYNARVSNYSQMSVKTAPATQTQANQVALDALHSGWHADAVIGGIFALAALLAGAGVLAAPSLLLSNRAPAWARAAALGGVVVALIGLLLAILTWFNILAAGQTAPPYPSSGS